MKPKRLFEASSKRQPHILGAKKAPKLEDNFEKSCSNTYNYECTGLVINMDVENTIKTFKTKLT